MKKLPILLLCGVLFLSFYTTNAQENTSENTTSPFDISMGADIMSRYVWRGTAFSTAPSIQPGIELGIKGLAIGAWGAYSFDGINNGAEADLYLSYTFLDDMLSVTFTDYFFPNETVANNNYFEYGKDATGHIFEGAVSFNGLEELPLTLLIATNFYGADAKKLVDDQNSADFNNEDGIQYSTYIELGYSFSVSNKDFSTFVGFTPNNPKAADPVTGFLGENGFYGEKAGIVNLGITGSQEIQISEKFALPIQASVIVNPMAENIFFVFGISF